MKMQSVILVGMESSSWGGELVVDCCMRLIFNCYIRNN
jgi:hypothetical protein